MDIGEYLRFKIMFLCSCEACVRKMRRCRGVQDVEMTERASRDY